MFDDHIKNGEFQKVGTTPPIEKALVNETSDFTKTWNSRFSWFSGLVKCLGLFLASIGLLIGNQFCWDLPIVILRYCAETFLKLIFRNFPPIPHFGFSKNEKAQFAASEMFSEQPLNINSSIWCLRIFQKAYFSEFRYSRTKRLEFLNIWPTRIRKVREFTHVNHRHQETRLFLWDQSFWEIDDLLLSVM